MADTYAIFVEIDRCTRCFACQVACNRQNQLDYSGGAETLQADDLVVVKAQTRGDRFPFVRYSCWHCPSPSCVPKCPMNYKNNDPTKPLKSGSGSEAWAIEKKANGAVWVNHDVCTPDVYCNRECLTNCQRGGYPKIGKGISTIAKKMFKCDMCYDWLSTTVGGANDNSNGDAITEPACVKTCPNKALSFGKKSDIVNKPSLNYFKSPGEGNNVYNMISNSTDHIVGDGSVIWASAKGVFRGPKADPFVEDHISPMVSQLFTSPAGKALVVPALIAGGLYALYKRKVELVGEES